MQQIHMESHTGNTLYQLLFMAKEVVNRIIDDLQKNIGINIVYIDIDVLLVTTRIHL